MIRFRLLLAILSIFAACVPRTPIPGRTPTPLPGTPVEFQAGSTLETTATSIEIEAPTATEALAPTTLLTVDADTVDRHERIFEQLWNTLNTQYVYPDFNGVDWSAVYDDFKARVAAGQSDEEFWRSMSEMIKQLDDDHSNFMTPIEAREQDDQLNGNLSYTGIGVEAGAQEEKRQAVIYTVFPGSPAEEAGLSAHDAILEIDGQPAVNADGTHNLELIRGEPGTPVVLKVKSPGQTPRDVSIVRRRIGGSLRVNGRLLSEAPGWRIVYLFIPNLWDAAIESSARQALTELMSTGSLDGLIVDMRTNSGGLSTNLLALLGFFTEGQHGEFVSRDSVRALTVTADPIGNSQQVPIVILISRASVSYAEVFSGVLREAGRARLVGQTTAGNIETIYGYDFEDGSRAWIARETFVPPSGDDWEATGLVPDVPIDADWDEFTEQNDPALAAALELLAPLAGNIPPNR